MFLSQNVLMSQNVFVTKYIDVTKCFDDTKCYIVITTWFTPDGVWKARGCIWLTPLLSHKIRAIEDFRT